MRNIRQYLLHSCNSKKNLQKVMENYKLPEKDQVSTRKVLGMYLERFRKYLESILKVLGKGEKIPGGYQKST